MPGSDLARMIAPHRSRGRDLCCHGSSYDGVLVSRISLVITDVDGTLVTPDKRLTDASVQAVRLLRRRGIRFTLVSSRPPMGLRMLIAPLELDLPIGAFSGGVIVGPRLEPVEQHLIPEPAARRSIELMQGFDADVWVFTVDQWLVRNPEGDYVPLEKRTIQGEPTIVADFGDRLAHACKIVGSSSDFTRLAECETRLGAEIRGQGSVARSQPYYLDVTAPNVDKGTFVTALSRRLGTAPETTAVLGDMDNDLPMFCKAGLSIAMGNASEEVKRRAAHVTSSNSEDGFAQAVERYILSGDSGR